MTSASELFHNRRSRFGRQSLDLGLDSSLDRSFHHHGNRRHYHHQNHNNSTRRDRRDLDGCDSLRRLPLSRHQSNRPFNSERDIVRLGEGSSQSSLGHSINLDNFGGIENSARFSGNTRLPGAVLLARERLLERLRGVSLSANRRSNRASSHTNGNELPVGDDFRLVDAGDGDTEISDEWLAGGSFTDSIFQTDLLTVTGATRKRPPGLTEEALTHLQVEVFTKSNSCDKGDILRASRECSICLESFVEGDELTCLPCAHRFHFVCLDPWVRTCGDCPYCRRGIVVIN